jgi:putative hemolysin
LLLPLALLTACASHMSEVQPVGKDQYRVSYNAGMRAGTWVEIKNKTRDRAQAYCAEQGMRMVKPETFSNGATGLGAKEATLVFTCEKPPAPSENSAPKL